MAIDTLGANALASNSVTSAKIVDGAVVAADVADGFITTAKLADDAITGAKLANDIAISTTGNIATTGSGTITSAGLITATGHIRLGGNTLDDYEEGEFAFTLTDAHSGSDTDNKMRYVKVGAMVFVEGPNRGSAGSNVSQYALLSGTANSNITLTASLPFVPIETGMAVSGIHRNLEKRDGSNENATSGNWLPMLGWVAGSATLTLTDTQSEKSYSASAGGHTLRKADNRTNIVMGFNFAYRTAS